MNKENLYSIIKSRRMWNIFSFDIVDEPLVKSILKYRKDSDREEVHVSFDNTEKVNGVGSKVISSNKHMPIIDLDFEHVYIPSTTSDHAHLYLNVPISYWRWVLLMVALLLAKVIEPGYFIWSIRRGHNQVRLPGISKGEGAERGTYTHGWFRKLKEYR